MTCDHKFIDSNQCAKCGVSVGTLRAERRKTIDTVRGETISSCSLADLEVLKALDAVPTAYLKSWRRASYAPTIWTVIDAELARREVQP